MRLIRVYNVTQNDQFINATVEYSTFWGGIKTRNIFYKPTAYILMKWADTGDFVSKIESVIHNECLNQLKK